MDLVYNTHFIAWVIVGLCFFVFWYLYPDTKELKSRVNKLYERISILENEVKK